MSEENALKIVILGEGRVGKTSILSKYFKKQFDSNQQSTINPSFYDKKVNFQGKEYLLAFWDTAGQEQFDAISHIYYQNAVGALLVYDVTIFETFQKVEKWVNTLREVNGKDITFLIAGNKFDLADKQLLEKNSSLIDSYCSKEKCKHFYTSAKTGYQLNEAFDCLINSALKKVNPAKSHQKGRRLEIGVATTEEKEKKGGCC